MKQRPWAMVVVFAVCLLLVGATGLYLVLHQPSPKSADQPTPAPTPEVFALPTLPPPLADMVFPESAAEYPRDWPADLRYPEPFRLAATSAGFLPGGSSQSWATQLRYPGEPKAAADALAAFFTGKDWKITEQTVLDAGTHVLLIERGANGQSGLVIVDADDSHPGQSKVLATILIKR